MSTSAAAAKVHKITAIYIVGEVSSPVLTGGGRGSEASFFAASHMIVEVPCHQPGDVIPLSHHSQVFPLLLTTSIARASINRR